MLGQSKIKKYFLKTFFFIKYAQVETRLGSKIRDWVVIRIIIARYEYTIGHS